MNILHMGTSLLCLVSWMSASIGAQEPERTGRPPDQARQGEMRQDQSKQFVLATQVRGVSVYRQKGGANEPATNPDRTQSERQFRGELIGIAYQFCVQPTAGGGTGTEGGTPRPERGGQQPNSDQDYGFRMQGWGDVTVKVRSLGGTGDPTQKGGEEQAGGVMGSEMTFPLNTLTWHPEERYFSCADSGRRPGKPMDNDNGDRTQRPGGMAQDDKLVALANVGQAMLKTQDNKTCRVSDVVLDLEKGTAFALLIDLPSGVGEGTNHEPPSRRPGVGVGEAGAQTGQKKHVIPTSLVELKLQASGTGGEPQNRPLGTDTMQKIELRTNMTAQELTEAPQIDTKNLGEFAEQKCRSQIEQLERKHGMAGKGARTGR